jgi:regulator of sigma E protease
MVDTVRNSVDIPLRFSWLHEGEAKSATITPTAFYDPISEDTIGQVGAIMPLQRRHIPVIDVVSMSAERSVEVIWLTLKTLYQLIIGRISRRAIGGPIAIARLSGESARWGFENLLGLLAIISINLGLINLFPIPVLDGGHVVISVIEAARRKRFSKRTRIIIQQIGYAIILLLIVFVTFNDITR